MICYDCFKTSIVCHIVCKASFLNFFFELKCVSLVAIFLILLFKMGIFPAHIVPGTLQSVNVFNGAVL